VQRSQPTNASAQYNMSFFDKSKLKQYYQILKNVIYNIINADNIFYKFSYFGKKMYSYSRTPTPHGSKRNRTRLQAAVDVNVWVPASSYRACLLSRLLGGAKQKDEKGHG
jgi:hypothetical protein